MEGGVPGLHTLPALLPVVWGLGCQSGDVTALLPIMVVGLVLGRDAGTAPVQPKSTAQVHEQKSFFNGKKVSKAFFSVDLYLYKLFY